MERLAPGMLLTVWEAGRQQHELDRALTLLAAASPGITRAELASLSIGERDARLLQLRSLTLGSDAAAFAECPDCGEQIEFNIDTAAFAQPAEIVEPAEVPINGSRVRFRQPNSRDLAAVTASRDAAEGMQRLLDACVIDIEPRDHPLPQDELLAAVGEALLRHDPRAESSLALSCPACGHAWETLFDVATFFWQELAAIARRLLREIDVIARAYGWSEEDILKLSLQRRQSYLEMIAA